MKQLDHTTPPKVSKFLSVTKVIVGVTYGFILTGISFLLMRIVLLLLAANPTSAFVEFVYTTSDAFMAPFRGIFPVHQFNGDHYLDAAAIFAVIMYLIFGSLIHAVSKYLERKITQEQAEIVRWQNEVAEQQRLLELHAYMNRPDTNVNISMNPKSGQTNVEISKPKSTTKKVGGR